MGRIWTVTVLASILILGSIGFSQTASAQTIFGTAHQDRGEAILYSIDALTGTATPIGTGTGIERVGAIDFGPDDGLLYAIGECRDSFGLCPVGFNGEPALFTIDTNTGIGTYLTTFDTNFGIFSTSAYPDMSFRASNLLLFVNQGGELVTIDRGTGEVTDIGAMNNGNGNGLSFGSLTLYHADGDDLSVIDQTSGNDISSLALDFIDFPEGSMGPRINAMDQVESSGTMFVSVNTARFGDGPNYLGTVDLSDGSVTNIGETVDGLDGLAIRSDFDGDGDGVPASTDPDDNDPCNPSFLSPTCILSECTADQYESTAPTETNDRMCTALTECTADQFESTPPTETSDRVCSDLSGSDDHYLGYDVKETKDSDKFDKRTVTLTDQFETDAIYKVEKLDGLYNPVDKNGEGISDELSHMVGYKIKTPNDADKFEKVTNVLVTNQFGDIIVDVKKPKLLLVPSLKDHDQVPVITDPFTINHFKCYDVKETKDTPKFEKRIVSLYDPNFDLPGDLPQDFEVKKPKMLCNPVEKQVVNADGTVETTPIQNPENHLMCYDIKKMEDAPKFEKRNVFTNNQFGPDDLEVKKQKQLCVPSIKTLP